LSARDPGRTSTLLIALLIASSWLGASVSCLAKTLPRVASINLCTDQVLLDLADPEQIVGLSPYSRDASMSREAQKAAHYPRLSGSAEELMMLKPDLVVASPYLAPGTRSLLARADIAIEPFDYVLTLAQTREQIARMGRLIGQEARASARIEALDHRLMLLKNQAGARDLRLLPLQRRGWVSGQETLISEILTLAGARNVARDLGFSAGGFASLEAVLHLTPDALLLSDEIGIPEDQGMAKLLHPALQTLFPPERRIVLPQTLTICGGAMLADALDLLIAQIRQIEKR
jgi:iron complex transport system substrate-binding protein